MPKTIAAPPRRASEHVWQTEAYRDYLASPEWAEKRRAALIRANHCCAHCGATRNLEVHHLDYTYLGEEMPEDLVVLCRFHHELADERRRAVGATTRNLRQGRE